jgi:hypothetical protein
MRYYRATLCSAFRGSWLDQSTPESRTARTPLASFVRASSAVGSTRGDVDLIDHDAGCVGVMQVRATWGRQRGERGASPAHPAGRCPMLVDRGCCDAADARRVDGTGRLDFRLTRLRSRASASYREAVPAQVKDGADRRRTLRGSPENRKVGGSTPPLATASSWDVGV